jgi:hypothetical protein
MFSVEIVTIGDEIEATLFNAEGDMITYALASTLSEALANLAREIA